MVLDAQSLFCAATGDYASSPQPAAAASATPRPSPPRRRRPAPASCGISSSTSRPTPRRPRRCPCATDARGAAPSAGPQPVPAGPFDGAAEAARRLVADRSGVQRARLPVQFLGPKRFHAPPISWPSCRRYAARDPVARSLRPPRPSRHQGAGEQDRGLPVAAGRGRPPGRLSVSADRIRQFDWWQDVEIDGLRLTATPAQHFPDAASPTAIARCGRPG